MTMRVTTGQLEAMIVQRLDLEAGSAETLGDDGARSSGGPRVLSEFINACLQGAPAPLPARASREQSA